MKHLPGQIVPIQHQLLDHTPILRQQVCGDLIKRFGVQLVFSKVQALDPYTGLRCGQHANQLSQSRLVQPRTLQVQFSQAAVVLNALKKDFLLPDIGLGQYLIQLIYQRSQALRRI